MKTPLFNLLWISIACVLSLSSCSDNSSSISSLHTTYPSHARLFNYQKDSLYTYVNVFLPQDTSHVFRTYLLHGEDTSPQVGKDTIAVQVPLKDIGCAHCTQIGFIKALGEIEKISCIGDIELLEKKSALAGREDLGEFFNGWTFDIERLISLSPDAVFFTPYGNEDIYSIEKSVRTPLLLDMSAWESHPLARSEWIKFVALFMDKTHVADSIFASIESKYNTIKKAASHHRDHIVVISQLPYEGIWYIPSGGSYKGILFSDASLCYPWEEEKGTGSLTVDYEKMLSIAPTADVWFIESGLNAVPTLSTLIEQNPLYRHFRPYKNNTIYICNTENVLYFEDGILEPHLILEDYVNLSRGVKDYTPHYYFPIQDE